MPEHLPFALHLRNQMLELLSLEQDEVKFTELRLDLISLCRRINEVTTPKRDEFQRAVVQG